MRLIPIIAFSFLAACSSTAPKSDSSSKADVSLTSVSAKELMYVKKMFPCKPDPDDMMKVSLSGDMPDITDEKCECVHSAMVKDMARPEFKEEQEKAKSALSRMMGLDDEALDAPDMKRMLIIGPLGNMETRLYKENAPNANAGLEAAVNVPTTTLKSECGVMYDDFGDMSPY